MSRRSAAFIIAGAVVLALLLLFLRSDEHDVDGKVPSPEAMDTLDVLPESEDLTPVSIYFPDANGLLSAEEWQVPSWAETEDGARLLLEALLAGPRSETLSAPLPEEVTLGQVHLSPTSILYVDLVSTSLGSPPASGSQMEMMSVYSMVNTLMLAIPEIEAVVLLWNGRQLVSFGGHLDTSLPLVVNRDLLRTRR